MIELDMRDKAVERRERTYHQTVDDMPLLTNHMDDLIWLGSFSWSISTQRVRLLDRAHVIRPMGIEQTSGEVSRDYLMIKYGKKKRPITRNQSDKVSVYRTSPLYAAPGRYTDMAYIDLDAAYWSIMRGLGWDVDYSPGSWIAQKSHMEDFPFPQFKLARNLMVTSGVISTANIWRFGDLAWQRIYNPLLNMPLWACVQDILHGLALDLIGVGAVYVHTDGYIVPMTKLEQAFRAVREWGLDASVRYLGDATIYGAGRYEIGDSRKLSNEEKTGSATANINEVDRQWLRWRVARLIRARRKSYGY